MAFTQTRIKCKKFLTILRYTRITRRPDPRDNLQKKNTYYHVDFAVPSDHRAKIKESENMDKYLNLS